MANFTKDLTVNGWTNLMTALIAAGYTGTAALSSLDVLNNNSDSVYIHLTNDAINHPTTGTDGVPVGQAEALIEKSFTQMAEDAIDAGGCWLYSATSVNPVIVSGVGGGI